MSKQVIIINGPNLNLLGERQPDIYGNKTMEDIIHELKKKANCNLSYFQSNNEGDIIDKIHEFKDSYGIIINAGGFTHTSVAIADAVAAIKAPVIEVHISNIYARESFRSKSYISLYAKGVISGLGTKVYGMALDALVSEG